VEGEIVMVMGYPASGKTSITEEPQFKGYHRLNRDAAGGKVDDLIPMLHAEAAKGKKRFILDNLYSTPAKRKPVIEAGQKLLIPVRCIHLDTSIEDAQVNVALRMIQRYGKLLMPEEISQKAKTDPNMFPTAVLFVYKKEFQKPTTAEGFSKIEVREFVRRPSTYTGEAVIFDYDGTLRDTKSGAKYPSDPKDVEILPGRVEKLKRLQKLGIPLLGISNQGDIGRGKLKLEQAVACFERTNELLGVKIEYRFCPHHVPPIACYCRKPMPGLFVEFMEKYQLDPKKTVYVGDQTTDKTAAGRAGVRYEDQADFFAKGK
jgi:HAD superfamily hydrolase (TIGR01662 family)